MTEFRRGYPGPEVGVPAGTYLELDPDTRVLEGGRVLLGGSPLRVLRLDARGSRAVRAWVAGTPVGTDRPERLLARRLLRGGLAHPAPGRDGHHEVTVVVPVKDRPEQLQRLLTAVPGSRVIVVDDGSAEAARTSRITRDAGARLVRSDVCGGPGAARNAGLARASTPLVAFVDSDCVPAPGWLDGLTGYFADPLVAAVAPRVTPLKDEENLGSRWLARYERASSALDLGSRRAPVVPRGRVSYVPTAALVVRRSAAGAGFDETMAGGEDVDFVWRLTEAGWQVRYEPSSEVGHQHRVRLLPWLRRRMFYGRTAAPLARRHPGELAPLTVSPWSLAAWTLVAARRPVAGLAVAAAACLLLGRKLDRLAEGQLRTAVQLAGKGTWWSGETLARSLLRTWWPVAGVVGVAVPAARLPLGAAALSGVWTSYRHRHAAIDPVRFAAAHLLAELAYGAGLWVGCLQERTLGPLVPDLRAPWPARKPTRRKSFGVGVDEPRRTQVRQ